MQIIAKLRDAEIISVAKGASGGYLLIKDPRDISIYQIVALMEGISVPGSEAAFDESELTLESAFSLLKDYIETYFQSITLDMLVGSNATSSQSVLISTVGDHIASLKMAVDSKSIRNT